MKQRLFSGVQPTGLVHIGNYLGAFANWARLQEEYDSVFCVVDLHALTVKSEGPGLAERSLELATMVLASGVDPEKATLFIQSHVPEHTELTWIFNTVTPMGELGRMNQFKDKARQHKANVNVGLFDYPVLQAADILLYKAAAVPVGEDQVQHVELTREIARRFNARWGATFPEPEARVCEARRVMGLCGRSKMSKSLGNYIAIEESPEEIWRKLAPAVTDTARVRRKDPGEPTRCNIYSFHRFFSSSETLGWVEQGCRVAEMGCYDCKKRLAQHMEEVLGPIRERAAKLRARPERVREILESGAGRCRAIARETMAEVRERLGLMPRCSR